MFCKTIPPDSSVLVPIRFADACRADQAFRVGGLRPAVFAALTIILLALPAVAFADSLDSLQDVYRSNGRELRGYHFGGTGRGADRFSELSGYHLDDNGDDATLPDSAEAEESTGTDGMTGPQRFNHAVNRFAEAIVGGMASVFGRFFTEDSAYAATTDADQDLPEGSVLARAHRQRDGLVRF